MITLACLCGAFAIGISTLTLVFMTSFSEILIQVALCVAIGLAFAWGTVGIGLAPSNFVPISGVFALGLALAYTFVVWDRIPFASANLKTALAALRRNWGVIGLTFGFQALFLVWSIFHAFTMIGVYDAFQDKVISVNHRWRILCYILLGGSYFWTFQVFMVRIKLL